VCHEELERPHGRRELLQHVVGAAELQHVRAQVVGQLLQVALDVLPNMPPPSAGVSVVAFEPREVRLSSKQIESLPDVSGVRNGDEQQALRRSQLEQVVEQIARRIVEALQHIVEHDHVERLLLEGW
jgi:hypothetical protein